MGLTRIRAEQISDIDYKQAVRVISTSNVTLSGGAPSTVDGVSLNAGDRILVAGQSTGSDNGLYDVTVVGTGTSGTWVRTSDANTTGEINAGMIVMVTEGNTYADTSWKLVTDDPIVIGTTSLEFLQNTGNSFSIINVVGSANVVANGVSSTVSFASGNNFSVTGNNTSDVITFSVSQSPSFTGNVTANHFNGNAVGLTSIPGANVTGQVANALIAGTVYTNAQPNITSVGTLTSLTSTGVISTSGNIYGGGINSTSSPTPPSNPSVGDFWYNTTTNAQYRYTFDGTDYFWLDDYGSTQGTDGTFSQVINGTSNVSIYTSNGNVSVGVNGTDNIAIFSTTGAYVSGLNITSSNPPATSTSPGVTGQIEWSAGYIYVCTATNTWVRAALSTW